ncbi:MAG TPA: TIGR00270 family protein [Euryarchaeota archaeon]|nr:TIGR00270 family protein [Euryarchaeota archaeon]
MNCEICGKEILKKAVDVDIEGTRMRVCGACARLGKRYVAPAAAAKPGFRSHRRPAAPKKEKVLEIVDDCAVLVRKNRERLGLTQDQLGAKINEKGSVISRIESGHMEPDMRMAKKLERFLGVTLLEEPEI